MYLIICVLLWEDLLHFPKIEFLPSLFYVLDDFRL